MAKKPTRRKRPVSQPKTPIGGPFLSAAVFCETIMEDKDGTLSAMRIVDNVNVWLPPDAPADVPSAAHPMVHVQWLLICFKTGDAPGKHSLVLSVRSPDGSKNEMTRKDIPLGKESYNGANIRVQIPFKVIASGTYWLDVILDKKRLSSVPFNFNVNRLEAKGGSPKKKK